MMNKYTKQPEPACPTCKGHGSFIYNERYVDGEYWCSSMDCHCTMPYCTPKLKAMIVICESNTRIDHLDELCIDYMR